MRLIKKQSNDVNETVITFEYRKWNDELEEIVGFIKGKKEYIPGYNEDKALCNIKVDDILYFEAVGELVFAYTNDAVYEVKMRLYQAEEQVENNGILRASKSMLVNIRKIESLKSALNGRLMAPMVNGEEIMISRAYSKNIIGYIKSA